MGPGVYDYRDKVVGVFCAFSCAASIKIMNIKHAVITSVDRDDLKDGGSMD
jgi:lipoate synthase